MRSPSTRTRVEPAPPPPEGLRIDTVLVLADARGKHLGSLARGRPPCLVPLHGRSVLDWQVAAIRAAGARRIVVVRGYRGEMITAPDVEFVRNPRFAVTGALASLLCAREFFGDGFAITAGNLLFEPSLLRATLEAEDELSCVVDHDWETYYRRRFEEPMRHRIALQVESERVVAIGGRARETEPVSGQPVGLFGVRGEAVERCLALAEIPRDRFEKMSVLDAIQALIDGGQRPRALPASGGWLALRTERDHELAEELSRPMNERLLIGR